MDRTRIAELFEQAVELARGERDAWLAAACTGDAPLRAKVERLLRADDVSSGFMETSPAFFTVAADAATHPPERFGPYRVLRQIGVGGMGEVWLAERSDGEFEQRVAIKRLAYPTPGLLQRFRQERQILARLEHPNIARLIDGGVGADGSPYLVMEYVEGTPITTYARERALDIPALLRLVLRVCEAVQYAHQNLIVHRDLKPSNIFVAVDGNPKLLDFGIAKVLTTTDGAAATATIARMLTPDYAAPEQFSGAPVTTATDVYALGIVLYELLCGSRPFRRNDERTSTGVRDAPAPSVALERATKAGAARRRELRGDLDRIALTAIAEDPARRYASAEALAADVRCYLDGRPIAARGDGAWYRLGKFARRNCYALAAALLVFVVSISATVISLEQARRAREQGARAEAVRKFLVGVFAQASPDESKGKPITAQELLEKSEPQIALQLAGQPALRADIATLLASLYNDIGNYGPAEKLLKETIEQSDATLVPPAIRARTLTTLAGLERDKQASDSAFTHASEALQLATAAGSAAIEERSSAQHMINQITVSRGDAKQVEPVLRSTLAADLARLGEQNDAVAEDYSLLGTACDEMTRYDESAAAFAKTIEISRALHGTQHNTTARGLNDLGIMLLHKGDLAGAERALRETNEIALQLYGADTDNTWTTRSNLLRVLELEGRYREALIERQAIFEAEQRLISDTRPDALAFASNFIGVDHRELGQLDESEAALLQSLALWAKIQGSNDQPSSANPLSNLAITQSLKGHYDDAERSARTALAIQEKHQTVNAQWLNLTRGSLGDILRLQHRNDEALAMLRAANVAMQSSGGTANPWLAQLGAQLSEAELDAGHAADAQHIAEEVLAAARKNLPEGNVRLAAPLFASARAALAVGQATAAEAFAREALEIRAALLPTHDPRLLEVKVALFNALAAQSRTMDANKLRAEIEPVLASLSSSYAADLRRRAGTP